MFTRCHESIIDWHILLKVAKLAKLLSRNIYINIFSWLKHSSYFSETKNTSARKLKRNDTKVIVVCNYKYVVAAQERTITLFWSRKVLVSINVFHLSLTSSIHIFTASSPQFERTFSVNDASIILNIQNFFQ